MRIPAGLSMLKANGFQVDTLLKWPEENDRFQVLRGEHVMRATLDDYGTVVLAAPRIGYGPKQWETKRYLEYVERGGNLLTGFVHFEGPHGWYAPWRARKHFGDMMGVDVRENLTTDPPSLYGEPAFVRVPVQNAAHPILEGVGAHQTFGSLVLILRDRRGNPFSRPGTTAATQASRSSPNAVSAKAASCLREGFTGGSI